MQIANKTSLRDLLKYGHDYLEERGIASSLNDAELLLRHILNVERFELYNDEKEIDDTQTKEYKRLLEERGRRVPLQYITGKCFFMGIELFIKNGVFIPRPETEILVDEILKILREKKNHLDILDIGTGSGAIAIGLAKGYSDCKVLAYDNSQLAIDTATYNVAKNGLEDKISFVKVDILKVNKEDIDKRFDLVISNPPYIRSCDIGMLEAEVHAEPNDALDAGEDGLLFYKAIIEKAKFLLKNNGILAFEFGFSQANDIVSILENNSFEVINLVKDFNGIERIIIAGLVNR